MQTGITFMIGLNFFQMRRLELQFST